MTFFILSATLIAVIVMKRKNFEMYDTELDYFFIVKVWQKGEEFYAYNHRILVRDEGFAKRFETRRSARRCIALSEYESYEIMKKKREHKQKEL